MNLLDIEGIVDHFGISPSNEQRDDPSCVIRWKKIDFKGSLEDRGAELVEMVFKVVGELEERKIIVDDNRTRDANLTKRNDLSAVTMNARIIL